MLLPTTGATQQHSRQQQPLPVLHQKNNCYDPAQQQYIVITAAIPLSVDPQQQDSKEERKTHCC
jgi:hypothetical protein